MRTLTARSRYGNPLPFPVLGATTKATYTGTHGVLAAGVSATLVRVICTSAAWIAWGTAPVADNTGLYVAADREVFLPITSGDKVSAVQVSSGGTLYVTACTNES